MLVGFTQEGSQAPLMTASLRLLCVEAVRGLDCRTSDHTESGMHTLCGFASPAAEQQRPLTTFKGASGLL